MATINPVYTSIGCNRFSNVCDANDSGLVAFGAGRFVALWDTTDTTKKGVSRTLPGHQHTVSTLKFLRLSKDVKGKSKATAEDDEADALMVTGDEGGIVKIWRKALNDEQQRRTSSSSSSSSSSISYECIQTLTDHQSSISALAVFNAPDGTRLLLTGGSDSKILFYICNSLEPFKLQQTIDLNGRLPLDIAISTLPGTLDRFVLAFALTEKRLQIWQGSLSSFATDSEADGFTKAITLEGHEDWIRCLDFAFHGDEDLMLASGSQDGYIRLWRFSRDLQASTTSSTEQNTAEDELNDDMLDEFERKMQGETVGPSRQLSTKAHLLRVQGGGDGEQPIDLSVSLEALLIGHEGWVTNVHWSPSELYPNSAPRLLSTSADNSMIIWSTEPTTSIWTSGQRFGEIGGRGLGLFGGVWAVGETNVSVVANGWNGGIHRWTTERALLEEADWLPDIAPTGHALAVKGIQWDPAGEYLLSVSTDQTTRAHAPWTNEKEDTTTWGEIGRPQIHGYDMTCVAFIDRLRFVSGADEKIVRVFDAPKGFASSLEALGVTKDDLKSSSRSVGASVPPLGLSNRALSTAVDPQDAPLEEKGFNQEHISISDELKSLPTEAVLASSTLWPEIEKLYGHGYELMAVATPPSGHLIASSCKATSAEHAVVRLYDSETWQQVGKPLEGHNLTITRIAFSHDERFILTCSRDRTWRLFAKDESGGDSYTPVAAEKPHARIIWDCAWSPNDSYFVTASRDKQVKFWAKRSEDGSSWEHVNTIKGSEAATAVAFVRDEVNARDLLAIGHENGSIDIYACDSKGNDAKKIASVDQSSGHVEQINEMAWRRRPDGIYELASASDDRSVKVHAVAI